MKIHKYNLKEHAQLYAQLTEAPIVKSSAAQYPGWKPEEPWNGVYAKYEKLLADKFKSKPFPLPFGKQAAYEMLIANDYIHFFEDGEAYSTNNAKEMGYGVSKKYPGALVVFKEKGKTGAEDPVAGYITLENGALKWNAVSEEESATEESNPVLDGFQLVLDVVGLVPGFGDIIDLINAAISFLRGNYLEGFLSLIGAIPIVGSVISLPLKALLKGFNKAGDIIKTAWKSGKSADEVWLFIKKSGKFDKKQLDMLAKGMGDASDYITKFRKEADAMLPDSAAKGLDEFAEFLKRQGDDAAAVFSEAAKESGKAAKGIFRVRKELDTVTGLSRVFGGRIARRMINLFNGALSPNELKALRGAMSIKFAKNMDNPGKLTALVSSMPKNQKMKDLIGTELGTYIEKLARNSDEYASFMKKLNNIKSTGSQALEAELKLYKKEAPELYDSLYKKIVNAAEEQNNPLYQQFMNDQINGLGSYFSKDYANIINWEGVTARFTNLVPVIYNELKDLGEDTLMAMGIEEQDDVNGLFWPLLKGLLSLTEYIPGVGGAVTAGKEMTTGALQAAGEIPLVGAVVGTAANKLGAGEQEPYDPGTEYEVVPETDPRLKQQKQAKTKRIQQQKRFF